MKLSRKLRWKRWRALRLTRKLENLFSGEVQLPEVLYYDKEGQCLGPLNRALQLEAMGCTGVGYCLGGQIVNVVRNVIDGAWYGFGPSTEVGGPATCPRGFSVGETLNILDVCWSPVKFLDRRKQCEWYTDDNPELRQHCLLRAKGNKQHKNTVCMAPVCPYRIGTRLATGDIELTTDRDCLHAASLYAAILK